MAFQGVRDRAGMFADNIHLAGPAQTVVEKAQDAGSWAWRHKFLTIGGTTLAWAVLSNPISPAPEIPVTPLEAAAGLVELPGNVLGWGLRELDDLTLDRGGSSSNNEAASPPTDSVDDTSVDETDSDQITTTLAAVADTVPSFNDDETATAEPVEEDVAATPTTATTVAPVVTATTVAVTPGESIVFSSGSMYCFKVIGGVVIGADEYAYDAIARATEEPLDDIDDSTGMATQVWEDIQAQLNGGYVENAPGSTMTVPDECHNYPRTDGSFVN